MRYSKEFLMKVLRTYQHSRQICFKPKKCFSEEQIQNALKIYEKLIDPNDLIGIMDITISEGGKKGYLLTQEGIYSYINRYPLRLDDIVHAAYDESQLIITTRTGQQLSWYAGIGAPYICEFLNEMTAIYDPEFDNLIEAEDASMMTVEDLALAWDNNRNDHHREMLMAAMQRETLYLPMYPEFPASENINIQAVGDHEFMMMNHMMMKPAVRTDHMNRCIQQIYLNQTKAKIITFANAYAYLIPVSFEMWIEYLKKHTDITHVMIEAYGTEIYIETIEVCHRTQPHH